MTGIRHCPRCHLRFSTASELEHHVADEHTSFVATNTTPPATRGSASPSDTADGT